MPDSFVHLHRHGEFSRLDGVGTSKEYAARAVELGQGSLAQTDHGTLSGALHHIAACRDVGIVPIVGVEAYYRPIRSSRMTRQAWHIILFAKNLRGWHNLLRLVSTAYAEQEDGGGFYQVPCVDDELLDRHREGIVCLSACFQSWLSNLIKAGDSVAIRDYVIKMKNRYGDDFWLEIQPHDFDDQRKINLATVSIANDESVGLVATNDTHFVRPEWASTQRVSKMMATNLTFEGIEKLREEGKDVPYVAELIPNLYLSTGDEMRQWFYDHHRGLSSSQINEALFNTSVIAKNCTPFMLDRSAKLPKITDTPEEADQLLSEWVDEGFERIKEEYPVEHWDKYSLEVYEERVDFEWEILKSKGVIPYMVMVADIIRWAKSKGIRIGLGRGSAAGCLISYLTGITAIDPIPWGLLFERFLNPGRKGLPDIDIDVQSDRRAEVKAYVVEKYGVDHVADIITHERFQPKSVIQRLCRVYDVPYMEVRQVTDTIDIRQDDEETTLEELLPINDKLREFSGKHPEIWEHALRLEGSVANAGKHAAGVVITPKPIVDYMALERGKSGDLVTSWSDSADFAVISDNGFLKIDLLGIKGLQRHEYACQMIYDQYGIDVDLNSLGPLRDPFDVDPEVLQLFTDGFTIGVFQFGSKGMTNLIRSIRPETALDLCAANALYRPGALKSGATYDYARIKNGQKEADYVDPHVIPVLEETYGLIAYQEQVMELSKLLAGFTPAQADDLRKAMGKLYRIKGGKAAKEFMQRYEKLWFEGCKSKGIPKDALKIIWKLILDRSSYSFNKSHSGSYSLESYQDAWLKKYYPLAFYASVLTFPSGSTPAAKQEFMSAVVREARLREIKFLPPHVNLSEIGWTLDGEGIRFGFTSIRDVGAVAAARIVNQRAGGYTDFDDLRKRCGGKVNKKTVEALTQAGAFDCWGLRDEASEPQITAWEKDRLRMVVSQKESEITGAEIIRKNIFSQDEVQNIDIGEEVIIGGIITKVEKKLTKNNKQFANVTVAFEMNEWRVKFWQNALWGFEEYLVVGNVVMINGKKDEWNGFVSVVASDMAPIDQVIKSKKESA